MGEIDQVRTIVCRHHDEITGFVDKAPSRLARGEAVARQYSVMKVDMVGSTELLDKRSRETYLKFAHTFLSSVDQIAQRYGADPVQSEYQGDGLILYFPAGVSAEDVVRAAWLARRVVAELARLEGPLGRLRFRCKIAIDYAELILARIGPRGDASLTAIGYPLHRLAKMEKRIGADQALLTKEFRERLAQRLWMACPAVYDQSPSVPAPVLPTIAPPSNPFKSIAGQGLLGVPPATDPRAALVDALLDANRNSPPVRVPAAAALPARKIVGYSMNWDQMQRLLEIT